MSLQKTIKKIINSKKPSDEMTQYEMMDHLITITSNYHSAFGQLDNLYYAMHIPGVDVGDREAIRQGIVKRHPDVRDSYDLLEDRTIFARFIWDKYGDDESSVKEFLKDIPSELIEQYPLVFRKSWQNFSPFYDERPDGIIEGLPRPDRGRALWSEIHRMVRPEGAKLLDDVNSAANKQRRNLDLAIVRRVANDMHAAMDKTHETGESWISSLPGHEPRPKRLIGQPLGDPRLKGSEEIKDANEELDEIILPVVSEASVQKVLTDSQKVLADPDATEAAINQAAETVQQAKEDALPDKIATLIADYHEEFPKASDSQLLDAIVLGEKVAVYAFISKYGFLGLKDENLIIKLSEMFEPGLSGGLELARMRDTLRRPPYKVPTGLNIDEVRERLAGHGRLAELYAPVEELLKGHASLSYACEALKALGIDEPPEILTGKEMAAVVIGCAFHEHNPDWVKTADKIYAAPTKAALQSVISEISTRTALAEIADLSVTQGSALATAQSLLADAEKRIDDLNVTIKMPGERVKQQDVQDRT